ncbi:F5/8 type C domain containing protein [Histomonas meleagridis]|uniref:F5/8 type C domain containing protein n=1 Tax=Histomonas meleagridis TaxID=135588 RepID=UPI00355A0A90|nr:F5/8 type C domain containing protein [Histomonas meleagridis]KAH0799698.1 F5/8 type C domain containing protein [Histomonas meleagridis]
MKSIEQIFTQSDISQIDQHQLFIFISSVVNTHRPTETSLFGYLDPQSLTEDELESLKSLTKSMNSIPMESLYNQIDSFLNTFAQQNQSIIEFRKKISDLEQSQAENDSLNKKRINKLKELINESTKSKPDEEQSQVSKQLSAFTDQLTQNQSLIDSLTAKCNELDDMYQTVSTMINSITSSGARPPDKKQEPKKTTSVRRSFFFGSKEKKPETPRVDRRAITFLVQQPKDPKAIPTSRSIEFLNRHQSTVLPNQAPSMGHPIAVGSITKEPTSENVPFSGILYYLTQQCGGNIHTEGIVNITASTTMGQGPETIVDFGGPWYWSSRNEPNSWVRFDFKEKTIQVSGYTIKTYPFQANKDHLKSWVLEGCNNPDNNSWETIHSEKNCNDLNGPGKWKTFKCNRSKEYRYIRIKSTGPNHIGYNTLVIANIEFFGILK